MDSLCRRDGLRRCLYERVGWSETVACSILEERTNVDMFAILPAIHRSPPARGLAVCMHAFQSGGHGGQSGLQAANISIRLRLTPSLSLSTLRYHSTQEEGGGQRLLHGRCALRADGMDGCSAAPTPWAPDRSRERKTTTLTERRQGGRVVVVSVVG